MGTVSDFNAKRCYLSLDLKSDDSSIQSLLSIYILCHYNIISLLLAHVESLSNAMTHIF
ncbi:hypothetical protein THOA03_120132 [Vibrio owensii]|nr:hypothetical protein THOA03_120132 [Vibrio owensii]